MNGHIFDSKYYTPAEFNETFSDNLDDMKLLHINARSLHRNFDHFENLVHSLTHFKFTVIGITETWLHHTSPPLYNLPNYTMVRSDRQGRKGGGVAFYIAEHLNFRIRDDIKFEQAEVLFIEINNLDQKNIIIGLIYRAPSTQFELFYTDFEHCLSRIADENKQIYFLGDFNINFLLSNHNNPNRFLEMINSYGFNSFINNPTRIDLHSSTLIDNIFSNVHDKNITGGLLYSEVSDHLPVFAICEESLSRFKPQMNNMYRKETPHNIELLKQDLALEEWNDVLNINDVNIAYINFNSKLQFHYSKNIPLARNKPKRNEPINPWITKGILKSIRTRNKLYKKHLNNPTDTSLQIYKTYRNKLTKIIRFARKLHFSNKIKKVQSNSRATWKVIKEVMGTKSKPLPKDDLTFNGNKITDSNDSADCFNSFFTNIGVQLADKIAAPNNAHYTEFLSQPVQASLFLNPTNPNEIINITRSLNASKSKGYDEISTSLLKEIIHVIAEPLAYIFNKSIESGFFPDLLKIAKVTPVFKKNNPHEITNYRPISILPSISKILEKIIYNRLYSFLNIHNFFNPNQYGFRKGHSTDLALVQIFDKIANAISKKEHTIGIFLDLSKAFDTLNHNILCSKLSSYGVRGSALLWFTNYLSNRKQYVTFNGINSQSLPIKCGVPQGSILGPLLFLIYINDIINTSSILSFILFADDTNIFLSHRNLQSLINIINVELLKVSIWFKCNKLSLNVLKHNLCISKIAVQVIIQSILKLTTLLLNRNRARSSLEL